MLDIKFIRENPDVVKKAIVDKRVDLNLDQLLDLDQKRRSLLTELESLQATKNSVSKEIPKLKDPERAAKLLEMKEVDSRTQNLKERLKQILAEYENLIYMVPNIPSPETPVGPDASANVPWSYWSPTTGHIDGKDLEGATKVPPRFDFEVKDHIISIKKDAG